MDVTLRNASAGDWLAVKTLIHSVRRTMPGMWWWEDHLTDELFLVVQRRRALVGAFLAWPDDSAVAWVRLAALEDSLDLRAWLELVLPSTIERLQRRGAQTLAWIDYQGWASPHLPERGFALQTEVITLVKADDELPHRHTAVPLRAASDADIPAVTAVDRAAFTPLWWNSEATLRRRSAATACFVVAEQGGEIVGYLEAERQPYAAHINRIAVAPAYQARGIGAALLERALRTLWRAGAEQVTLNTQSDNSASLRLYRRFGFRPTGDRLPVWERPLRAGES